MFGGLRRSRRVRVRPLLLPGLVAALVRGGARLQGGRGRAGFEVRVQEAAPKAHHGDLDAAVQIGRAHV